MSGCSIENDDPLTVSFDLFASEQGTTSATIMIDGQAVHSETVDYNPNGSLNEITVPSSTSLPTGRNMPVEIDV